MRDIFLLVNISIQATCAFSFLVEHYYVTFGLWHEPSVRPSVCRLSVTMLHHRLRLEYFCIAYSSGTRTVCIKILGKNSNGIVQVKYNGY